MEVSAMINPFKIAALILILISTISSPTCAIEIEHDVNGDYLINSNEMALYFFVNDKPYSGISNCYGSCEYEWPIVFESISSELSATDFGTITRSDGRFQTTYRGRPLYWYRMDQKGKKEGEGKYGLWYVMKL